MTNPKRKIFIVGCHRSGTTWLANCLAEVEGVFTPQLDLHHGQIESAFFSSLVPYFNNGFSYVDRVALFSAFVKTDFFGALGIPEDALPIDATPAQVFCTMMDLAAETHNCDTWIEKSPGNSLVIDQLMKHFPEAYFIRVKRNLFEQCISASIGLRGGINFSNLYKTGFQAGLFDNILSLPEGSFLEVRYENLVSNFNLEIGRCLSFAGLEGRKFERPTIKPNSSYSAAYSNVQEKKKVATVQKLMIAFGYSLGRVIPRKLIVRFLFLRKKIFRNKLPKWLYATLNDRSNNK